MAKALFHLMRLQFRGLTRRSLRGAHTPRRLALFVLGALMLVMWVWRQQYFSRHVRPPDPNRVRLAAPFALLGICLLTLVTSVGDRAISFTPGEVDLLLPGPFTRRQLILYKLSKSTVGAALSAIFLCVMLHQQAKWWPACYTGVFLSLLLVQFFSINAVIAGQRFGAHLHGRLKFIIFIRALAAAVFVARHVFAGGTPIGPEQMMVRVSSSPVARILLAPFACFGEAMTVRTFPDLLRWAAPAITIDAALLCLLLMMDSNYLEAASVASDRRSAHLQRIRGGSFLSIGISGDARWHVPQPPFLGGIGPVLWRQITSAVRSSKGLLFLVLILAVGVAPLVYSTGRQTQQFATTFAMVAVWLTLLVSTMLKFDFRGDLDLMDALKSLPLRPWALAAGQLIAPSLLLGTTHLALLAVAARVAPQHHRLFVCAAVLVLPFDSLLFAVENLLFLLFPTRPAAASPGDFQILGRQALVLSGKTLVLAFIAIPPMVIAGLVWIATGKSLPAATAVAAALFIGEVLAMIPIIGWAFVRFDPSIHTPA